jgi:hypothetical protein
MATTSYSMMAKRARFSQAIVGTELHRIIAGLARTSPAMANPLQ